MQDTAFEKKTFNLKLYFTENKTVIKTIEFPCLDHTNVVMNNMRKTFCMLEYFRPGGNLFISNLNHKRYFCQVNAEIQ